MSLIPRSRIFLIRRSWWVRLERSTRPFACGVGACRFSTPNRLSTRPNCVSQSSLPIWLTRNTLYRWRARYQAKGLRGLRPRSRRPRRCRRKRWAPELTRRLIQLRQAHPGWGKQKLTVLLHREGYAVSVSTVGRMVSELLRRGRIARSP